MKDKLISKEALIKYLTGIYEKLTNEAAKDMYEIMMNDVIVYCPKTPPPPDLRQLFAENADWKCYGNDIMTCDTFIKIVGELMGLNDAATTVEDGEKLAAEMYPIFITDFNLPKQVWSAIKNYTHHSKVVIADTFYAKEVEADFYHSKESKEEIAKREAPKMLCRIIREGYTVYILDGSGKELQSISPPLYDKNFRNQIPLSAFIKSYNAKVADANRA